VCTEFDSWYEESFLGGAVSGEAPAAGSATNVPASKAESLARRDTCVREHSLSPMTRYDVVRCFQITARHQKRKYASNVPVIRFRIWPKC